MIHQPRQFDLLIFDFTSYQATVDVCFFLDRINRMTILFITVFALGI